MDAVVADPATQKAINHLECVWGDRPCPYCHGKAWQVGTAVALIGTTNRMLSPAIDQVTIAPAHSVMCGACGHTTFINAAIAAGMGLM